MDLFTKIKKKKIVYVKEKRDLFFFFKNNPQYSLNSSYFIRNGCIKQKIRLIIYEESELFSTLFSIRCLIHKRQDTE